MATSTTRTVMVWRGFLKRTIKALRQFSYMDPPTSLLLLIMWQGTNANICPSGYMTERSRPFFESQSVNNLQQAAMPSGALGQ